MKLGTDWGDVTYKVKLQGRLIATEAREGPLLALWRVLPYQQFAFRLLVSTDGRQYLSVVLSTKSLSWQLQETDIKSTPVTLSPFPFYGHCNVTVHQSSAWHLVGA